MTYENDQNTTRKPTEALAKNVADNDAVDI